MDSYLDIWINDKLHSVLGMSDKTLIDYVK